MNFEIVTAFLENILLLLSIAAVYSIFPLNSKLSDFWKRFIMGLLISSVGIVIMSTSYELAPGVILDARSILLSITGMFIGFIPTMMVAVSMIVYHLYIGGPGAFTGILWVITAGAMGLLWRKFRLKNPKMDKYKITWLELYLFSLLIQVFMVGLLLTLPGDIKLFVIDQIAFPLTIIYPLGGLLISEFMLTQRHRFFQNIKTINSEEQYRNLFKKNNVVMFLIDANTGKIEDANDTAIRIYGYTLEEFKTLNIKDINTLPNDKVQIEIDEARVEEKRYLHFKHRFKDGKIINVEVHSTPIELNDKTYILNSVIDITDKVESARQFKDVDEKLKATLLSVGEGIIVFDNRGRISLINNRAKELIDDHRNLINKKVYNVFRIYSNSKTITFAEIINKCLRKKENYASDGTFSLITNNDDKELFVEFTVSLIDYEKGIDHGGILAIRDTTIERETQKQIRFASNHDYLTTLYNRFYFEEQLKRLDTPRQLPLTLILGDLNGLKLLNDTFSHLEGDRLLIEIAKILKKATRSEDIVARWGGDEFVILLPKTSYNDAQKVYHRIKDLCKKSMYKPITPSISLGCATKTESIENPYDILKIAEERMYHEKLIEGKTMRSDLINALEKSLMEKTSGYREHTQKKIEIAKKFASQLKLNNEDTLALLSLARLHDIGKISINEALLQTPKDLTSEDWKVIKMHPEIGKRLVQAIPELQNIVESLYYHHEHFDGTGYPEQLKGEEIPLLSRIITIVDAFEIMIDGRNYLKAVSISKALAEIKKKAGSQFDPTLVSQFIEMYKER